MDFHDVYLKLCVFAQGLPFKGFNDKNGLKPPKAGVVRQFQAQRKKI